MSIGGIMESIQIKNSEIILRKINAIKRINKSENNNNKKLADDNSDEVSYQHNLNVDLRQPDDKKIIEVILIYRIPSIQNFELEMDAEFIGTIFLKEPCDISTIFKEDVNGNENVSILADKFMPFILKEIDKNLIPIFKSFDVNYMPIS
ncbi:MAG: hypothetical protein K8S14_06590 [Actinomycetia bacterium]|nr:hypothetical protein [Actinomycetes bacterium]